jgi:hypothetical protein
MEECSAKEFYIPRYLCALLAHYRALTPFWSSGLFPVFPVRLFPTCLPSDHAWYARRELEQSGWIRKYPGAKEWHFVGGRTLADLMCKYGIKSMEEGRALEHACIPPFPVRQGHKRKRQSTEPWTAEMAQQLHTLMAQL